MTTPSIMAKGSLLPPFRPPLMPLSGTAGETRPKARPPKLSLSPEEGSREVQSFCMSTPRKSASEQARHYIGTPRADSILSAFMDFDDGDAEDDGPPLDFDEAMAVL